MLKPTILCLLLLLCATSSIFSQQIVNKYAAVEHYIACSNAFQVDTATAFHVGDTILVIQMRDAIIDSSNSANFGTVANYRSAGNYGYNIVSEIHSDTIYCKYVFNADFHISNNIIPEKGLVQIVRVPYYQNYNLNQPHTCMPWTGTKGGVFAINVANTLTLNSSIDVSAAGFKGGQVLLSTQSECNRTDYYYNGLQNMGAAKGSGIVDLQDNNFMYGRGSAANGGGGGNDNKSGGGGGGNAGAGGNGGNQYNNSGCAAAIIPDIGGVGGRALPYSTAENKIFMGGGGGAGHGNELGEKPGGNGGGIVIINANQIISNTGSSINANGADAPECSGPSVGCQNDGTGGGGGGGAVFLNNYLYNGTLVVNANGGKGANAWVSAGHTEVAPGGGGGGGAIIFRQSSTPTGSFNTNGGLNGVLPQFNNSAWGALPGQNGQLLSFNNTPFPSEVFSDQGVYLDFDIKEIYCGGYQLVNLTTKTHLPSDNSLYYEWHVVSALASSIYLLPAIVDMSPGDYSITLFGNSFTTPWVGCLHQLTKTIHIDAPDFANAGPDITACMGGSFELHATSGGVAYFWEGDGIAYHDSSDVVAQLSEPGIYTYILKEKDSLSCIDSDTMNVTVVSPQPIFATSENSQVSCQDKSVQLHATGADSYIWSPGNLCNDSTIASPIVHPTETTTFTVKGHRNEGCDATDTITIYQYKGNFETFTPNAFSPNGDGLNEEFTPVMLCGFTLKQFSVYNRFGQRMFSTTVTGKGWNGVFDNKPADIGTYFYYISGKRDDGKDVSVKGDFSLLR